MKLAALIVLGLGMALALMLAVDAGGDPVTLAILALVLATGALGIAVVRRSGSAAVGPARCFSCGGLISPNAPYCKHCGEPLSSPQ